MTIRLTDILAPDCVKAPLNATEKQGAIFELVDLLVDQAGIDAGDELREAVWQREQTRTTGIGHGIAIPHGKIAGLAQLYMAVGKPATPIDFGAIDDQPVDLIFLLASPIDQTGPHIQALAQISRMLTDGKFRDAVNAATDPQTIFELIARQEAEAPA